MEPPSEWRRWRVGRGWARRCHEAGLQEAQRLTSGRRYHLGALLYGCCRPWKLPAALWRLLRRQPPQCDPRFPDTAVQLFACPAPAPDAAAASPDQLEAVRLAWQAVGARLRSARYLLGGQVAAALPRIWRLLALPLWMWRHRGGAPLRPAPLEPLPQSGPRQVSQRGALSLQYAVPDWCAELLHPDGARRLDQPGPPADLVILAGPEGKAALKEAVTTRKSRPDQRLVWWQLPQGPPIAPSDSVDAIWRDPMAAPLPAGSVPVVPAPPFIQPRLHNPVGWWSGRPELGVTGRWEADVPAHWRPGIRLARGEAGADAAPPEGLDLLHATAPAWVPDDLAGCWRRLALVRAMHQQASLRHRIAGLRAQLLLPPASPDVPLISIITTTNRPQHLKAVLANVARQRYPARELVLVLHGPGLPQEAVDSSIAAADYPVRVLQAPDTLTLGACHQLAGRHCEGRFIAKMDDDDWYGPHYLGDLVRAMEYTDAGLAGKGSFVLRQAETNRYWLCNEQAAFRFHHLHSGASLIFRREVLDEVSWRPMDRGEDRAFVWDCLTRAIPGLSVDWFHFVYQRHPFAHAWPVGAPALTRLFPSRPLAGMEQCEDVAP